MDDVLLFGATGAEVRAWAEAACAFVEGPLGLAVKREATVLAPVSEGVPFLGFRVWPAVVRLDGTRRTRLVRRLRRAGCEDEADSVRSAIAHAAHAGTVRLRRSVLARGACPRPGARREVRGRRRLEPGEPGRLVEQ